MENVSLVGLRDNRDADVLNLKAMTNKLGVINHFYDTNILKYTIIATGQLLRGKKKIT